MIHKGHRFYVGKTGSGKTIRVIYDLRMFFDADIDNQWSLLIINPKNSKDWNDILKPVKRAPKIPSKGVFRVNWVVKPHEYDLIDVILEQVYAHKTGKVIVLIDEGQNVNDYRVPYAAVLWQQGREMDKFIWLLAQRPAIVSRFAITQSNYFFIYSIIGEKDLGLMDEFLDCSLHKYIAPEKLNQRGEQVRAPKRLNRFECLFYDVAEGKEKILNACPDIRGEFQISPTKPKLNPLIFVIAALPVALIRMM